jgi:hypothetical protein
MVSSGQGTLQPGGEDSTGEIDIADLAVLVGALGFGEERSVTEDAAVSATA